MLKYLIGNRTLYLGRIYLKFEKDPEYFYWDDYLNRKHINFFGLFYLVSRIRVETEQVKLPWPFMERLDGSWRPAKDDQMIEVLVLDKNKLKRVLTATNLQYQKFNPENDAVHGFYNKTHQYVGNPQTAMLLYRKGIESDAIYPQIGYRIKDQTVWGWSHRFACGFKKGNKIFDPKWLPADPNIDVDTVPFKERGYKTIENLMDARLAAMAFAKYAS